MHFAYLTRVGNAEEDVDADGADDALMHGDAEIDSQTAKIPMPQGMSEYLFLP